MEYEEQTCWKAEDGLIFHSEKQVINHCKDQDNMKVFNDSYLANFMDYNEFDDMLTSEEFAKYLFEVITDRYNF